MNFFIKDVEMIDVHPDAGKLVILLRDGRAYTFSIDSSILFGDEILTIY